MKFLFENSFDAKDRAAASSAASKKSMPRLCTEQELIAARDAAYADGVAAGRAAAMTSIEQTSAQALTSICTQVSETSRQIDLIRTSIIEDAMKIVTAAIHKVVPELARHNALSEIERLIGECLQAIYDEPRVVVRSHDRIISALQTRIDAIAASHGFQGKIVLFADEQLNENDCLIEWADGGAERILDNIWKQIDAAIASITDGGALTPPTPDSSKLSNGI